MKSFPVFLKLTAAERVVIAGGGEAAAQKLRLMARTEARIAVMAPDLDDELAAAVASGRVTHVAAVHDPTALAGARLAIVATGCAGADAAIATVARAAGCLVNVVDRPALCDVTTPAIVDRDPVVIAIGTEGTAPVLSRQIKSRLEAMLEPSLGQLAAWAGRTRGRVAYRVAPARRRAFWEWFFEAPRRLLAEGDDPAAERAVEAALAAGEPPDRSAAGRVSLVDAGPGPADMVTLRAVARMQGADVILHAPLRDREILELPRRDAERVALEPGADATALLIEAAREGRQAVYLAHGDHGLDTARLEAAGVAWERVEGVAAPSVPPTAPPTAPPSASAVVALAEQRRAHAH